MKRSNRNELLAAEAADWVVALADADHRTRVEFADWLRASPENIREFLAVAVIWRTLPDVSSQPTVEELVRLAASQGNVIEMPKAARSVTSRRPKRIANRRRRLGWAVSAAIVLSAIGLNLPFGGDPEPYVTLIGEQSSVPLPDGSLVNLNTRSSMRVAYSAHYRDIFLDDGEALFDVAENIERPFRVITDQLMIVATGTQFNVRMDGEEVTVTVVEGGVDVTSMRGDLEAYTESDGNAGATETRVPMHLEVGQQARIRSGSREAEIIDAVVEKAIAWREHRLIFESVPLQQVIEEFNRYNDPPTLIEDEQLQTLAISGIFRSDDRQSFLQFLQQMGLAEFAERPDGAIALTRAKND